MQALEGVQGELNGLAEGCGRICAALAAARGASAELLSASERAAHDLGVSETRSALVEQFLQQYQLAPGEVAALQVLCLAVPSQAWCAVYCLLVLQRCRYAARGGCAFATRKSVCELAVFAYC